MATGFVPEEGNLKIQLYESNVLSLFFSHSVFVRLFFILLRTNIHSIQESKSTLQCKKKWERFKVE